MSLSNKQLLTAAIRSTIKFNRQQVILEQANERIAELETDLTAALVKEQVMIDLEVDLKKANDRIAELEEDLGIAISGMNSNWDSYQMETMKTEKLSAELKELELESGKMYSALASANGKIELLEEKIAGMEVEIQICQNEGSKFKATLEGLLNLTENESSEGAWKVTLEYDNSGDRAMVIDGDGNIIGECFADKEPNEQFLEAIDMAIKTVAKNDLEAIRTGITLL